MIARKEALVIARNLRVYTEKKLGRIVDRSEDDAEKKASTDINSAVSRGQFPYAQDRDGYPEWAFHLLCDIFPAIVEAERGTGGTVQYGQLDEIEIPEKYEALWVFADFRSIIRNAKKTFHTSDLVWQLFQTAFNAVDYREPKYEPAKEGAESIWSYAQGHIDDYARRKPTRKAVLRDIELMVGSIETIEKALARDLSVFDLTTPPFASTVIP